jgi:hypothetical protein
MPADSVAILAIASFPQRRDIRSALVRGSGTPAWQAGKTQSTGVLVELKLKAKK